MAVFPDGAPLSSSRDGIFCLLRQSPLQFEQHQLSLWDCGLFDIHLQYFTQSRAIPSGEERALALIVIVGAGFAVLAGLKAHQIPILFPIPSAP